MKLIKYLFYKWKLPIYAALSAVISLLLMLVTAGGIALTEIDLQTMCSKKHKGLYIIGELLDIDGDCGGYNLQWAWTSAFIAANSILEGI